MKYTCKDLVTCGFIEDLQKTIAMQNKTIELQRQMIELHKMSAAPVKKQVGVLFKSRVGLDLLTYKYYLN